MNCLNNEIALVTDAAMGIGHATVETLAAAGATVFAEEIVDLK
ncbi:hypothetical protein HMP09_2703 [Sphingomonas sp. HMP9]|nr:hypothetical protein [Sphingomonas sp. HMP9]BCA63469.1 hypothetical protein HMP09_2703 [Sphingomonas sp. HMP9]